MHVDTFGTWTAGNIWYIVVGFIFWLSTIIGYLRTRRSADYILVTFTFLTMALVNFDYNDSNDSKLAHCGRNFSPDLLSTVQWFNSANRCHRHTSAAVVIAVKSNVNSVPAVISRRLTATISHASSYDRGIIFSVTLASIFPRAPSWYTRLFLRCRRYILISSNCLPILLDALSTIITISSKDDTSLVTGPSRVSTRRNKGKRTAGDDTDFEYTSAKRSRQSRHMDASNVSANSSTMDTSNDELTPSSSQNTEQSTSQPSQQTVSDQSDSQANSSWVALAEDIAALNDPPGTHEGVPAPSDQSALQSMSTDCHGGSTSTGLSSQETASTSYTSSSTSNRQSTNSGSTTDQTDHRSIDMALSSFRFPDTLAIGSSTASNETAAPMVSLVSAMASSTKALASTAESSAALRRAYVNEGSVASLDKAAELERLANADHKEERIAESISQCLQAVTLVCKTAAAASSPSRSTSQIPPQDIDERINNEVDEVEAADLINSIIPSEAHYCVRVAPLNPRTTASAAAIFDEIAVENRVQRLSIEFNVSTNTMICRLWDNAECDRTIELLNKHVLSNGRSVSSLFEVSKVTSSSYSIKVPSIPTSLISVGSQYPWILFDGTLDANPVIEHLYKNNPVLFKDGEIEGVAHIAFKGTRERPDDTTSLRIYLRKSSFLRFLVMDSKSERRIILCEKAYTVYEDIPIRQCSNCLAYDHTGVCIRPYRCKRCGGSHRGGNCTNIVKCCVCADFLAMYPANTTRLNVNHTARSNQCLIRKRAKEEQREALRQEYLNRLSTLRSKRRHPNRHPR